MPYQIHRNPCPNCKQPVPSEATFCPNCGAALSARPPWSTARLLTGSAGLDTFLGLLLVIVGIPLLSWGAQAGVSVLVSPASGASLSSLVFMAGILAAIFIASAQRDKAPAFARGVRGGLWFWLGVVVLGALMVLGILVICAGAVFNQSH